MQLSGTLKSWNDDRGFGFIEPAHGGQEIFVHIKAFPAGTGRPSVGQQLTFDVETTDNGKKRARSVQYPARARPHRRPREESPAPWTLPRLLALPVFAAIYGYVAWRSGVRPAVLLAYLGLSLAAFMAYAFDKSAAISGRWRTAENTLHLFALAGGWPGALLAQQVLRHKTSKPGFVGVFWITVALNVAAFVGLHAGLIPLAKSVG
ncbi:cold shock and DUF1294 domain-containing protein [Polaromonas sp.]|jgi:uncharacterized membrane protein YsdA (DUF1294 family)/cold shock CspA family protein|uniref:cold shock and DUF1294 domain-containing protein n=1 Tax=Polaromonas sp. TaxID=1869339 RepID=UPI002C519FCF|nr:cold shock and DUF1294 domain-containing protein [Polaromonas sp.]HQS33549.1 cold shock and DUF1294 domain-containing protein [Polaromonas sp.]HQS89395.1 cold shock and DUF1294 domain-containing protein [Polaromonas sp.]